MTTQATNKVKTNIVAEFFPGTKSGGGDRLVTATVGKKKKVWLVISCGGLENRR